MPPVNWWYSFRDDPRGSADGSSVLFVQGEVRPHPAASGRAGRELLGVMAGRSIFSGLRLEVGGKTSGRVLFFLPLNRRMSNKE